MEHINGKHIMLIAGEVSGDMHGAELVKAIKARDKNITFSALGGPVMQAEGVELIYNLTQLAVIGLCDVIKHLGVIWKVFHQFLDEVERRKPACVILIDYPGFNLRMAAALKKRGIKVIHYIAPQVWAWRPGRVKRIKKVVDRLLVLFEFEKDFFAQRDMDVDFVGHPLVDTVNVTKTRFDLLSEHELKTDKPVIGLVPGSREKEIIRLLPAMLDAAQIIYKDIPHAQFLIPRASSISEDLITTHLENHTNLPITVIANEFYNTVNACDVCMVTSGTATLETALLEKPMVIVYKTTPLTYCVARMLVNIQHIGLVNIVAQKEVVPECLQHKATGKNIARKLLDIYSDPFKMETAINALKDVRHKLGDDGANQRAAEIVLEEIPRP